MISKNSAWSIAGSAMPAASGLFAIPILFLSLGNELFSICSLLISLTVFFFVYDFGIARTVTYFIAKSDLDKEHVNQACRQGILWAVVFGCLTSLLIYSFAPWFVQNWLKVSPELKESVIQSFRIAAWSIPASVISHVFRGILEGHSDFKMANIGKMVSGASIFLAPLFLIQINRLSILNISIVIMLSRYISLVLYLFLTWKKVDFKKTLFRIKDNNDYPITHYGAWAAISGLISTLFVYGDRFFVAGYIEAETLAIYIGAQDILIRYLLIPWSMAIVLLPVFAAGKMQDMERVRLYRTQQKKIFWLSIAFVVLVIPALWVLADFLSWLNISDSAKWIVSLQVVGIFFAALSQLPLVYLLAQGKPKVLAIIYTLELVLYIMIAPKFLAYAHEIGAGLLWAGRLVLEYGLLTYVINKK